MSFITEGNRDNLCDILWWLKGYMKGANDNLEHCPFHQDHIKTLDEVVRGMRDEMNAKKETVHPELPPDFLDVKNLRMSLPIEEIVIKTIQTSEGVEVYSNLSGKMFELETLLESQRDKVKGLNRID